MPDTPYLDERTLHRAFRAYRRHLIEERQDEEQK
jgi:hypothetical protein